MFKPKDFATGSMYTANIYMYDLLVKSIRMLPNKHAKTKNAYNTNGLFHFFTPVPEVEMHEATVWVRQHLDCQLHPTALKMSARASKVNRKC